MTIPTSLRKNSKFYQVKKFADFVYKIHFTKNSVTFYFNSQNINIDHIDTKDFNDANNIFTSLSTYFSEIFHNVKSIDIFGFDISGKSLSTLTKFKLLESIYIEFSVLKLKQNVIEELSYLPNLKFIYMEDVRSATLIKEYFPITFNDTFAIRFSRTL